MRFSETKDEDELITAFQKGDSQCLDALLDSYKPLLYSLANRLHCPRIMTEELIQSGYIGLLRAAERFDLSKNTRFITYCVPWILGEMKMTMRFFLSGYKDYSLDSDEYHECSSHLNSLMCAQGIDVDHLDLRLAIQKLKHDERTLILLRYFRDKTQTEAAILLRKSQSQISRLEHRALSSLKEILS